MLTTAPPHSPLAPSLRDLLGNAPLDEVARLSMGVGNVIQNHPNPGVRLAAVLAVAQLAVELSGLPVYDCLTMTRNVMNHAHGIRPEFGGVKRYLQREVFKQ